MIVATEKPADYYVVWADRQEYQRRSAQQGTTDVDLIEYYFDEDAETLEEALAIVRRVKPLALYADVQLNRRFDIVPDDDGDWSWETEELHVFTPAGSRSLQAIAVGEVWERRRSRHGWDTTDAYRVAEIAGPKAVMEDLASRQRAWVLFEELRPAHWRRRCGRHG